MCTSWGRLYQRRLAFTVNKHCHAFVFNCRKYVLVAIQDEGKQRMTSQARQALRRIGAKRDVRDYRGSIAMVGQTGGLGKKHIRTVSFVTSGTLAIYCKNGASGCSVSVLEKIWLKFV